MIYLTFPTRVCFLGCKKDCTKEQDNFDRYWTMAEGNDPSIQFPSLYISYPTFNSCMFTIMQGVASTDGKFLNFVHLVFFWCYWVFYTFELSAKSSCLVLLCIVIVIILLWTVVFGVPIEVTVQRQQSSRVIPHILVRCADYLILSGTEFHNYVTSLPVHVYTCNFLHATKFPFNICLCLPFIFIFRVKLTMLVQVWRR